MKKVTVLVLFGFLCLALHGGAVAKDIRDVSHLELIKTFVVDGDVGVSDPVLVEEPDLEVDQEYLLGIIDGDGISIWSVGPLTRTCNGRFKVNRLDWGNNAVFLFALNGIGNSKDAQSFFRFTPLGEDDRVELYISDWGHGDNRGYVEVGLFKILKQLKNLDRGVK